MTPLPATPAPSTAITPTPASVQAAHAKAHKSAQAFEASFLSSVLNSMFDGVKTAAPFGGGEGESAFRSFLNEAMAKAVVKRGGVGVSAAVERELIRLQAGGHA